MATPWDAHAYDVSCAPQQAWASEVMARLDGIRPDATVLDVGCGTGRVTESLLALVPHGRVLAIDASEEMVALARARLGGRAQLWRQDVLDLGLPEPVDVIVSAAALHWVTDHDRMWGRLARAPSIRNDRVCRDSHDKNSIDAAVGRAANHPIWPESRMVRPTARVGGVVRHLDEMIER
jgi:trans-aconitate 2-methyltransferase